MADADDGPDTSSIKPISSLRSRFENIGKSSETLPGTPVAQRQASLGAPSPVASDRPRSSASDRSTYGTDGEGGSDAAVPRKRRPSPPVSRPRSVLGSHSPPRVTVEAPTSPLKLTSVNVKNSGGNSPAAPLTPSPGAESPTRSHARTPSRATTPALEARISVFANTTDPPKPSASNNIPALANAIGATTKAPPPVNRAAKPQIPSKPAVLTQSISDGLNALDSGTETTDRSVSPFNTPPRSGSSSPSGRKPSDTSEPVRHDSDASFVSRLRNDSDASFVERISDDAEGSVPGRFRATSNASWVERIRGDSDASSRAPSSLPESYSRPAPPPPTQRVPGARQHSPSKGLVRTATVPVRSSPIPIAGRGPSEAPFEQRASFPNRPVEQIRAGRMSPSKLRSGQTTPGQLRSGRSSPVKAPDVLPERRSLDAPRPAVFDMNKSAANRIPATKPAHRSALTLGFDQANTASPHPPTTRKAPTQGIDRAATFSEPLAPKHIAPEVPAPRRSLDTRRKPPSPPRANGHSADDYEDYQPPKSGPAGGLQDYPDASQANRRPPRYKQRPWQIPTDYDTKLLATCGEYAVTTGYLTKAWSLRTGELLLNMAHSENIKVTALVFKPSATSEDEGKRVWLGTSIGEIHEIDIAEQTVVKTKSGAHLRREIIKMFRHASQLWTLDDAGELNVWMPRNGLPSLDGTFNNFRIPRGHTFSMSCGSYLWIATGKDIRVFRPGARADSEFQVLREPLSQPSTGDVTSGATVSTQPDLIYFGHSDGKISVYDRHKYSCVSVVNVSVYKISSLAGVGEYLWAGYNTGMVYVYDVTSTPWKVKKDWQAHEKQIGGMVADKSALWKMDRLHVVTLGTDNMVRIWDGTLEEDWLETQMQKYDSQYCTFDELTVAIMTWNAGASKPSHLQHTKQDNNFFREYLAAHEPPDIFVFGFQELVDLEDKKVTAKSFFKAKKKDPTEQEHMSHAYRAWRDHLVRCLEDYLPTDRGYALLHTASLVGLFSCVFVRSSLRSRIQHVHTAEVKRGMGGLHGNKGAIIVRFVLDDSSICLLNCHLAAGQTQTIHRNNDIAAILEAEALPPHPLSQSSTATHSDVFTAGGDGSMVLDHEICILNGDLNYRIDTMGRDTVIKHIRAENLPRLLERDQLLLSRKKNPGFRLRAFNESPISFAPTYKYNVQTDEYDTSEKRRAPAWCDRILYRGRGKVKMDEYRRWEVRVSDHRPVSGRLRIRVKSVNAAKRTQVWERCLADFEVARMELAGNVQMDYLTNTFGMSAHEAASALKA